VPKACAVNYENRWGSDHGKRDGVPTAILVTDPSQAIRTSGSQREQRAVSTSGPTHALV